MDINNSPVFVTSRVFMIRQEAGEKASEKCPRWEVGYDEV